ncbi:MAG: hypothetical protein PHT07_16640 [Paludibacter sp.]|nr:hypothetical protein [Paludibacter sp.]
MSYYSNRGILQSQQRGTRNAEHGTRNTERGTQISHVYANEADLLNVALFGKTALQWRNENPTSDGNTRVAATLEQLVVLSNLESINAVLIQQKLSQSNRIMQLNQIAISQMKSLVGNRSLKKLK